jgi:glycosyl-4,4'-diaponeurosporenoate acyltransferase
MSAANALLLVPAISAVWPVLYLVAGFLAHRLPSHALRPDGWLFRERPWERGGRFYDRRFNIRRWKDRLPEAGAFFRGGFSKRSLQPGDASHVGAFVRETCRAELGHWCTVFLTLTFFLWLPWWIAVFMPPLGLAGNLPCIAVQRYNRPRLRQLKRRLERS